MNGLENGVFVDQPVQGACLMGDLFEKVLSIQNFTEGGLHSVQVSLRIPSIPLLTAVIKAALPLLSFFLFMNTLATTPITMSKSSTDNTSNLLFLEVCKPFPMRVWFWARETGRESLLSTCNKPLGGSSSWTWVGCSWSSTGWPAPLAWGHPQRLVLFYHFLKGGGGTKTRTMTLSLLLVSLSAVVIIVW
jgi:hypothetical protein